MTAPLRSGKVEAVSFSKIPRVRLARRRIVKIDFADVEGDGDMSLLGMDVEDEGISTT